MGIFESVVQIPELQRLKYDMTRLKSKDFVHICLVGPTGTGRHTHAVTLANNMDFEVIAVSQLIRDEAATETDRGKYIRDVMAHQFQRVHNFIVIDLIKEEMIRKAYYTKGFVLDGFPCTVKQTAMFVKEIGKISAIVYLYTDINILIERTLLKHEDMTAEKVRKSILHYTKEIKKVVSKYGVKLEKVKADGSMVDVYSRVENVVGIRLNIRAIMPSDYPIFDDPDLKQPESDNK